MPARRMVTRMDKRDFVRLVDHVVNDVVGPINEHSIAAELERLEKTGRGRLAARLRERVRARANGRVHQDE